MAKFIETHPTNYYPNRVWLPRQERRQRGEGSGSGRWGPDWGVNYYRSSTPPWCSQKQAQQLRQWPRRRAERRAGAAEGKGKGESRKQDLRGLNQQTDEVIGPRFLEVKASGWGRNAGAWKVGQRISRGAKLYLWRKWFVVVGNNHIVLFDLRYLERLELARPRLIPPLVISHLHAYVFSIIKPVKCGDKWRLDCTEIAKDCNWSQNL